MLELPTELIFMVADIAFQQECRVPAIFQTCKLGRSLGQDWCKRIYKLLGGRISKKGCDHVALLQKMCNGVQTCNVRKFKSAGFRVTEVNTAVWAAKLPCLFYEPVTVNKKRKRNEELTDLTLTHPWDMAKLCEIYRYYRRYVDNNVCISEHEYQQLPQLPCSAFGRFVTEYRTRKYYFLNGGTLENIDSYSAMFDHMYREKQGRRSHGHYLEATLNGLLKFGLPRLLPDIETCSGWGDYPHAKVLYHRLRHHIPSYSMLKMVEHICQHNTEFSYFGYIHLKFLLRNAVKNRRIMQWDQSLNPCTFFATYKKYYEYKAWCYDGNVKEAFDMNNSRDELNFESVFDPFLSNTQMRFFLGKRNTDNRHVPLPLKCPDYEELASKTKKTCKDLDRMKSFEDILHFLVVSLSEYMDSNGLSRYVRNVCRYKLTSTSTFFLLDMHNTYWHKLQCPFTNNLFQHSTLRNSGQISGDGYADVLSRQEIQLFEKNLKTLGLFDTYFPTPSYDSNGVLL